MANLHAILGIRLQDWLGMITSHQLFIKIADTTTLAQIATDVAAYCALLDPLTDAKGVSAHFTLQLPSTGLKTTITVNNEISDGALFAFSQQNSPYKFSVMLPAFAEAKVANGGVNLADTDVSDWYDWLISNATHLIVETKAENELLAFQSVRLNTRKHRKSETRVSYRTG